MSKKQEDKSEEPETSLSSQLIRKIVSRIIDKHLEKKAKLLELDEEKDDPEKDRKPHNVTTEVTIGCDEFNPAYFLAYPLSTLAINRMANTVISRKPKNRLLQDLADMWRIGRWKAVFAGFVPVTLYTFLTSGYYMTNTYVDGKLVEDSVECECGETHVVEEKQPFLTYWKTYFLPFYCSGFILTQRLQCIDYPYRNRTWLAIKDSGRDGFFGCTKGIPFALFSAVIVYASLALTAALTGLSKQKQNNNWRERWDQYKWSLIVPAGLVLAHPFSVVSINVMLARINKSQTDRELFRNSWKASKTIWKLYGLRGFYRGFVPATLATLLSKGEEIAEILELELEDKLSS